LAAAVWDQCLQGPDLLALRLDRLHQFLVAIQYRFAALQECLLALSHLLLARRQLLYRCRHRRQLVVDAVLSLSLSSRSRGSFEAGRILLRALVSLNHARPNSYRRGLRPFCPRLPLQ
jgi:hypothetical protein